MYLKKRELWGSTATSIAGDGSGGNAPASGPAATGLSPETAATVGELVSALDRRRMHREVTLALRSGIRDATADFSFLRLRGLRNLLKSLRSIANSDEAVRLFRYSQSLPELQGIEVSRFDLSFFLSISVGGFLWISGLEIIGIFSGELRFSDFFFIINLIQFNV